MPQEVRAPLQNTAPAQRQHWSAWWREPYIGQHLAGAACTQSDSVLQTLFPSGF